MTAAAVSIGVFGLLAFWLWVVTYQRVVALENRLQAIERRLAGRPEA